MNAEETQGVRGGETLPMMMEAIVAGVALLAIFFLGVTFDPSGPGGFLVFVPYAVLVVTYILAFGALVRRLT